MELIVVKIHVMEAGQLVNTALHQHLGFCQRDSSRGHPFLWATPLKSNAEVGFDSLAEMAEMIAFHATPK
jgi:hypothetical protein